MSLTDELAGHQRQFDANRDTADELCRELSREQFNWQPEPGRWSMAECMVHLNISARLFGEAMLSAAEAARTAGVFGEGPFHYGLVSRFFFRAIKPGNQKRYKAPRRFVPPAVEHEVGAVLDEFRAAGTRWEACVQQANGLDLARVRVPSPALSLLKLPLGAMLAIQAMHEQRHLLQARLVKEADGFPAA